MAEGGPDETGSWEGVVHGDAAPNRAKEAKPAYGGLQRGVGGSTASVTLCNRRDNDAMRLSTNALKATALALPLSFGALTAQAADITETIQQTDRLGTFYRALEAAGMVDTLQGGGP